MGDKQTELTDELCSALTDALLDIATWARHPPALLWESYGGDPVRGVLQPRLRDDAQFFDALAELRLCGQIHSIGNRRAQFDTKDGRPDLYLLKDGEPVWIEAKHIHSAAPGRRLADVVRKANKQFKSATRDQGAGALHITFGTPFEWESEDHNPLKWAIDDLTGRILTSERNRSVAQAIVSWSDYVAVHGDRDTFAFVPRRRARAIDHPSPRSPASIPDMFLTVNRVNPYVLTPNTPSLERRTLASLRPHRSLAEKLRFPLPEVDEDRAVIGEPGRG